MKFGGAKEKWLRKRKGFLWLPLSINGETRWLERAVWFEQYNAYGKDGMTQFYRWDGLSWDKLPQFFEHEWIMMYNQEADDAL